MKEIFLVICSALAAITSIVTIVGALIRPVKRLIVEQRQANIFHAAEIAAIKEGLENQSKQLKENYLAILRVSIFNEGLPLHERVDAGHKYIAAGGNGTAEVQHDTNVDTLKGAKK